MRYANSLWIAGVVCLGSTGCSLENVEPSEEVGTVEQTLAQYESQVKWDHNVPICFYNGSPSERSRVRAVLRATWQQAAHIDFSGFGSCPSDPGSSYMPITFLNVSTDDSWGGKAKPGPGARIPNTRFQVLIRVTPTLKHFDHTVIHEVGHALGFAHEHQREDDPEIDPCSRENPDNPGDTKTDSGLHYLTPFDPDSVMTYCSGQPTKLSFWDTVGAQQVYGARTGAFRSLITYYHPGRSDHATAADPASKALLLASGYRATYGNGWIFSYQVPSSVKLDLYYSAARKDYISVATAQGRADATAAGYTFSGTQGYVYPSQQPGTMPLEHFWNAGHLDNFLTSDPRGIAAGFARGDLKFRTEGWAFPELPYRVMLRYSHHGRRDYLWTRSDGPTSTLAADLPYSFYGADGVILRHALPGTRPVRQFWSPAREEHYATATSSGMSAALAKGYSEIGVEGYIFSAQAPGTQPVEASYNASVQDNATGLAPFPGGSGYSTFSVEGYTFNAYWFED